MTKTRMKKSVSIIMLIVTLMTTMVTLFAVPASAATSGEVNSSSYCTVQISNKLLSKRGKQYAKVKINTSDLAGWKNSAKIRVTLRDQYGNYITSFVTKGGTTIKLGDDHSVYRIYVEKYNEPVKNSFWSRVFTGGSNWLNSGAAVNWKVTNPKDCTIR